jgi:hypothetical protein
LSAHGWLAGALDLFGPGAVRSLTGNVTDPSGAAVPGAKIEVLNVDTGISVSNATFVNGAATNLNGYAIVSSATGERQVRFALKLSF